MDTSATCCIAALLFSTFLFLLTGRLSRSRNISYPPTVPGALPILGHLHLIIINRRRQQPLHQTLTALSAAHGPVLLLHFGSRPVLCVSSPSAAESCLTTNDITFANRPPLLSGKYVGFDYSAIGSASYGPHLRNLRRIATMEILSSARIHSFTEIRADETRSLLRSLFSAPSANILEWRRVEMREKLKNLTFNTVIRMMDGRKYYGEEATVKAEVGERFRRMISEAFRLGGASNVEDFLPWLGWLGAAGGAKKRLARLRKEMDEIFQGLVEGRRQRLAEEEAEEVPSPEKTIVDAMLGLQKQEPAMYSDEIIRGMIWSLIAAGTDSTSGTMEWALSLLLNHPDALKKAREEIDLKVGHGRLIADSDLPGLRHLQNIIKETLRLFPPGPLLLPHQSSADCTVEGYRIPGGTMLLINAYAIHRDPGLWKEAARFRPERFDEGEGEGFLFFPFGSGRRRCPGEIMANRVVGLAVGALVQCFEWRRVEGEEGMVDLREGEGLSLPKLVPLEALVKPREAMLQVLSQLLAYEHKSLLKNYSVS